MNISPYYYLGFNPLNTLTLRTSSCLLLISTTLTVTGLSSLITARFAIDDDRSISGRVGNCPPFAYILLVVPFALIGFYPVARLVKNDVIKKLGFIFASTFAIGALLNVLFDSQGNAITLGNIPLVYVAILIAFVFYLFGTLADTKEEEPKAIPEKAPAKKAKKEEKAEQPVEEKAEEPASEEAPAEEQKSEE